MWTRVRGTALCLGFFAPMACSVSTTAVSVPAVEASLRDTCLTPQSEARIQGLSTPGFNAREQLSVLTVWGLEASGGLNGRGAAALPSVTLPWLVTRNSGGLCGQWDHYPNFPKVGDQVAVTYFVMRSACEYQEYLTVTLGFALQYEYFYYYYNTASVSKGESNIQLFRLTDEEENGRVRKGLCSSTPPVRQ